MARLSMIVDALRHIGIVVRDLDLQTKFYRDFLGMEIVNSAQESTDFIQKLFDAKLHSLETVKLKQRNSNCLIELLHYNGPDMQEKERANFFTRGITHFALTISNIDILFEKFKNDGLHYYSTPQLSPDGKVKLFFGEDPEKNLIEFVQPIS